MMGRVPATASTQPEPESRGRAPADPRVGEENVLSPAHPEPGEIKVRQGTFSTCRDPER